MLIDKKLIMMDSPVAELPNPLMSLQTSMINESNSENDLALTPNLGKLVVFTGPSGVGKGTLLRRFLTKHPEWQVSISATTRSPRPGEVHGQHYYFLSCTDFQFMIQAGDFLEWAEFAGNFYGTPRQALQAQLDQGQRVILEIELEGARQVRTNFPNALNVFVLPPSLGELENRLRSRDQDSDEAIKKRLERAQVEIESAREFDVQIVNDDLEQALEQLEAVTMALG